MNTILGGLKILWAAMSVRVQVPPGAHNIKPTRKSWLFCFLVTFNTISHFKVLLMTILLPIRLFSTCLLCLFFSIDVFAQSSTLYVDSSVTNSGNGTTWSNAISDLSVALEKAMKDSLIDNIHIAKGTYYPKKLPFKQNGVNTIPVEMTSTQNIDRTFHIKAGLKVYGGFPSGGGTYDPVINKTILDGSKANGIPYDTARTIIYIDNTGYNLANNDTTIINGFIIQNGYSKQSNGSGIYLGGGEGGGIYCAHQNVIVQNCKFYNNFSTNGGGGIASTGKNILILNNEFSKCGNAISVRNDTAYIIDNKIYNNGSGIISKKNKVYVKGNFIEDHHYVGISLIDMLDDAYIEENTISNCKSRGLDVYHCPRSFIHGNTITDNWTTNQGGGIRIVKGKHIVSDNLILRDSANRIGGGGLYSEEAVLTITGNTFSNNFVNDKGGAIYTYNDTTIVKGNIITDNLAEDHGGVYISGYYDTIVNNIIANNTAISSSGGGTFVCQEANIVMGNVICNNTAVFIGGILVESYNMSVVSNNTFYSNVATTNLIDVSGGALFLSKTYSYKCSNNIFWKNKIGNSDTVSGADFYVWNSSSPLRLTNTEFKNNLLQLPPTNYTKGQIGYYDLGSNAVNNIHNVDPLFANPILPMGVDGIFATIDDGLQLSNNSQLLNAGDSTLILSSIIEDISGRKRVFDNNIDMGAYELSCEPANISNTSTLCDGISTLLKVNSISVGANVRWYADSISTTILDTGYVYQTAVLNTTDTFWVSVKGCSDSTKRPIVVNVVTPPIITIDNFTLSVPMDASSYQWVECNPYNIISGANNSSYTVTKNGDYTVIKEKNGCIDTATCVTITGVNVQEVGITQITNIHPNPTNGIINIVTPPGVSSCRLQLSAIDGRVLYTEFLGANATYQRDFSTYANGIYVITIETEQGRYTQKFIKQ